MENTPQPLLDLLQTYQEAVNLTDVERAAALFLETAWIKEEGVQYSSVRAVLDYLIGAQTHLTLSAFASQNNQVSCLYHEVNALDRVVGYPGSSRKAEWTFSNGRIASLVIHPLDPQKRQEAQHLITPFFTWLKTTHPAEWAKMSDLSYESGATLAAMAQRWRASNLGRV